MQEILTTITSNEDMFSVFVVFIIGGLIAIIAIVTHAITKSNTTAQREKSRREIAAYIAEGSMTAEDGERLMAAGNQKSASELAVEQQAKYVSA